MWWREIFFTALYTGYVPVGSGTAGALLGMAVYLAEFHFFGRWSWAVNLLVVLAVLYPSIRLCDDGERFFGKKDPSEVVLDEVVGYWVTVLFYPFSWKIAVIGFFLFRAMDIVKPYPIRRLEHLKGGLGIMMDDCIAGVYANLVILMLLGMSKLLHFSLY